MGRRLHFHHADRMVRAILARTRLPDLIPELSGCQIVFREFTALNALDSAAVFAFRSDASVILGRTDSDVPSAPPRQYDVTIRHRGRGAHLMPNDSGIFGKPKCRAGRNRVPHSTG
jgi:hypothetical protein